VPTPGTLNRISGLVPELRGLALELIHQAEARGMRVTICRGRCTTEEQARIHAANPTGSAPPGSSRHEKGEAFDVCFLAPNGSWSWDESHPWQQLGELGERLGLVWGGRWRKGRWAGTKGDRPHFELASK
jgi:peptidoglycan L-alanyl-D-glutamate endopeptidase CwlK